MIFFQFCSDIVLETCWAITIDIFVTVILNIQLSKKLNTSMWYINKVKFKSYSSLFSSCLHLHKVQGNSLHLTVLEAQGTSWHLTVREVQGPLLTINCTRGTDTKKMYQRHTASADIKLCERYRAPAYIKLYKRYRHKLTFNRMRYKEPAYIKPYRR